MSMSTAEKIRHHYNRGMMRKDLFRIYGKDPVLLEVGPEPSQTAEPLPFAQRLAAMRQATKMTAEAVADRIGIKAGLYQAIESGQLLPDRNLIGPLASFLVENPLRIAAEIAETEPKG